MDRDAEIFNRRERGDRVTDLATEFNLSKGRISKIHKEQTALRQGGQDLFERLERARYDLLRARAISEEYAATIADLRLQRARGELISRDEVRVIFTRVFSSFRQAIKEMDRRYGPEAAEFLIAAERAALSTAQD